MTALVTATDTATNATYALYGYSNATSTVTDNRQIWESAAVACAVAGGMLTNITTSNIGFVSNIFKYYTSTIPGATVKWGNRRVCAWVGVTNIADGLTGFTGLTYTSELFWAEDNGAMCGAVSLRC